MSLSFFQKLSVNLVCMGLFCGGLALAEPLEIQAPALVDGELPAYSRVQKDGKIWYPASVVGYFRGINFAYDHATQELFANGIPTHIPALVLDKVVYIRMKPRLQAGDLDEEDDIIAYRYKHLQKKVFAFDEAPGDSDLFRAQHHTDHPHPWAGQVEHDHGTIINLDPTSEAHLPAHMQPGARPPSAPPAELPNHLPRPGEETAQPAHSSHAAPEEHHGSHNSSGGVPRQVTTNGGPQSQNHGHHDQTQADPNGLQPIPVAVQAAPVLKAFQNSGPVKSAVGENSVFRVQVVQGAWQKQNKDSLLKIKIEQLNISAVAQSNLGTFAVLCDDGTRVEASRTRSYLPTGTLDPNVSREGDLIFRFKPEQHPKDLQLEGALPLSLPLSLKS